MFLVISVLCIFQPQHSERLDFCAASSPSHTSEMFWLQKQLEHCNSLYMGIEQSALNRLQLVQNAAARLLTGTKKCEHITPVLSALHWLPVRFRIDLKILLFVFKALNGLAPADLSELIPVHQPSKALRPANQIIPDVPRTKLKNRGDRLTDWQWRKNGGVSWGFAILYPAQSGQNAALFRPEKKPGPAQFAEVCTHVPTVTHTVFLFAPHTGIVMISIPFE